MASNKHKYIVKAEYENGNVWVFIRTWDEEDRKAFWDEWSNKSPKIKALTTFPFADFDKDDNTGRWWNVANVKGNR